MSKKIVVQGANCSFLVLPSTREMRPYNLSRVMQQFGRRKILPNQGDASPFVINYDGFDKIPFTKTI